MSLTVTVTKRLAALPLALMLLVGYAVSARAAADPFGKMTPDEVSAKIGKPNIFIYDNNSKSDFSSGHVPSAKWLDYDSVTADALPKDKTATLIFYCANEH